MALGSLQNASERALTKNKPRDSRRDDRAASPCVSNNTHKSERASSLARPRPLCSDFRRSGSDSRSQRLSSRNHSAPTSNSPCFYLTLLGLHSLQELFQPSSVFQLRGPSLVADSRRPPLVCSLLLEDHSSAESNTTLEQREC
jgi:hypothetical protein